MYLTDFRFRRCSSAAWQPISAIRWCRSGISPSSRNFPDKWLWNSDTKATIKSHQLLQPDPNACPNVFTTNSAITCNALRFSARGWHRFGNGLFWLWQLRSDDCLLAEALNRRACSSRPHIHMAMRWQIPARRFRARKGLAYLNPTQHQQVLYECLVGHPSQLHDWLQLRNSVRAGQTVRRQSEQGRAESGR